MDRVDGVDRVQTIVGVDGGIGICRRYRYVVQKWYKIEALCKIVAYL